jgi:uncharacterized membrane protein
VAFAKIAFAVVIITYPLIVYIGLDHFEARTLALILFGLAVARLVVVRRMGGWAEKMPQTRLVVVALLVICSLVFFSNSPEFLRYYPVFINVILLTFFFSSLVHPPTVIEQIARQQTPDLPQSAVSYTRNVTIVWCGFFVFNGSMALYTCLGTSMGFWAAYNGLISYSLMGVLFIGEYIIRHGVQQNASDPVESKK